MFSIFFVSSETEPFKEFENVIASVLFRFECMSIQMYVYTHVHLYMYTYVYIHLYTYQINRLQYNETHCNTHCNVHTDVCIHIHTSIHINTHVYASIHIPRCNTHCNCGTWSSAVSSWRISRSDSACPRCLSALLFARCVCACVRACCSVLQCVVVCCSALLPA